MLFLTVLQLHVNFYNDLKQCGSRVDGLMTHVKDVTVLRHSWGWDNVSAGQQEFWGGGSCVLWRSTEQLAWCESALYTPGLCVQKY